MTDKLEKYYKWYESEYLKILNIEDLQKKARADENYWLYKACDKFRFRYSSIWRYETLATLKYNLLIQKTGYSITVFRIRRGINSVIYAIIYSLNGEILYCTTSPTYKSADGEYRHRFVRVKQLLDNRKKFIEIYTIIEDYISTQINNKEISFEIYSFDENPDIIKQVNELRLPEILFASCWLCEYANYISIGYENHIVANFHKTVFTNGDADIWNNINKTLKKSNKISDFELSPWKRIYMYAPSDEQVSLVVECGQKLIPMTVKDSENIENIQLAPWRELYILQRASDLVINNIAPGIPLISGWFIISPIDKQIFDNKINHTRIEHSEIADSIIQDLEDARRGTYILDPVKKSEIYISYKMEELSNAMEYPMDYAEKEIVLSQYVLCIIQEHIGRSFADIPALMESKKYRLQTGQIFADYTYFAKYIFEMLYNLHMLNTKLNIIHGDLHLNNAVIFSKFAVPEADKNYDKLTEENTYIVYRIGKTEYTFPHAGKFAGIIDFSRGFILNNLNESFSEHEVRNIISNYKSRILNTLQHELPEFMRENALLVELNMNSNFTVFYSIFTAIDIYKFFKSLHGHYTDVVLNNKERMKLYGNREMLTNMGLPLLGKLYEAAYNHLVLGLTKLPAEPHYLSGELIKKYFNTFTASQYDIENATLIDIYSEHNPLQWSASDYECFPPIVKLDYAIKNKIHTAQLRIDNNNIREKYERDNPIEKQVEKIKANVRAQHDKRHKRTTSAVHTEDYGEFIS